MSANVLNAERRSIWVKNINHATRLRLVACVCFYDASRSSSPPSPLESEASAKKSGERLAFQQTERRSEGYGNDVSTRQAIFSLVRVFFLLNYPWWERDTGKSKWAAEGKQEIIDRFTWLPLAPAPFVSLDAHGTHFLCHWNRHARLLISLFY